MTVASLNRSMYCVISRTLHLSHAICKGGDFIEAVFLVYCLLSLKRVCYPRWV